MNARTASGSACAFGSLLLPLKSVVPNLLSLLTAFGAIKWIFQDGHLPGPLGFEPIGAVDASFPVLVVAIAFGLAKRPCGNHTHP